MPTRRTARARAGTRRRSQRNMMAIGRGKHGAGRNSRPAKLQSNFSPRTPEQQRKPRSTRDQRAKRFNNLENPTRSAKPPPPVQIRAAPPISLRNQRLIDRRDVDRRVWTEPLNLETRDGDTFQGKDLPVK